MPNRYGERLLTHPSGLSVELLDHMGDDLAIVNAARVSYGKESAYEYWRYDPRCERFERREHTQHTHVLPYGVFPHAQEWHPCLNPNDAGLLNYLMRERHGTPFEMVQMKFRVRAPIGVIWEWVRHRIASYNIMSTRYVEWDTDYYVPEAEEWRAQVGKAGHYRFVPLADPEVRRVYVEAMESAFRYYGLLIGGSLAKEVARNVLPMGAMTEMIWSINARSLLNFLSLRMAPNALREMQLCACMVATLAEGVIPETILAWRRHGKRTP